jgi:transposase
MPRPASLPSDVESLQRLVRAQQAQLLSRDMLIAQLKLQLSRLKRMTFGQSSEQLDTRIAQLELSLEELEASAAAASPTRTAARDPAIRPARQALPDHLPREPHVHEPLTGSCHCPACGGALRRLGEDTSEVLEYVPEHWKVIKHVRPKYSCGACQQIVQASAPSRPIDRSYAGPGLLAHTLVSKYCDHIPYYRQSQIYARDGIELDRSTLADWAGSASSLLDPLLAALEDYVMAARKLHADDTPIPVLAPGTGKTKTGRLWAYLRDDRAAGSTDPPAVLFRYSPDRKGERPREHLKRFRGVLQADAYGGFNGLYDREHEPLIEAACWAHARRKIFEVYDSTASPIAFEALERIGALYKIEADMRGRLPDERRAVRQARAAPLLKDLHEWMRERIRREPSRKSDICKAFRYTLSLWTQLTLYAEDGRIEIDNNPVERQLRAVALGRKNYLFAGSDAGGERAAAFYSLIGSAKLCGLDPQGYLRQVFGRIAEHPINRIEELLPWNLAEDHLQQRLAA